ncbi:MAG TPA: AarF/UbiB family protein [Candidatus Dormibacteraeota bacterium]|jgi:ubiquinone biosynthesis protein|nr:AarF/UbiB family protein [Candidatus Dormibacteraeota bacterium]
MIRTVNRIRNLPREREIAEVFARHGFGFVLRRYALGRYILRFRGWTREEALPAHWGDELRQILEELGPTYIKVGQILSVRPDILPPDVLLTLRGLRDEVPAVPFEEIRRVIEEDLDGTIEELFDEFSEEVIGSASIGQVYVATYKGRKVAVKVQRPRARYQVEADLPVIADIADVVARRSTDLPFDPTKLVQEIKAFLYAELDYLEEARNTSRVREDFRGDERVIIPEVFWERTSSRVLTTEFVEGTPLSKINPEDYTWEDRRKLAVLGAEISLTQVFEHGAFHGDAHPSNIIVVSPEKYGLIDFGLIGQISEREMRVLTDYLIHLVRGQAGAIVRDMRSMGMQFERQHDDDIAAATEGILRRYTGVTLAQVDTQRLVNELLDMVYRYHIQLPTKYFLVLRGLITVEGTGRELYPDFNVFEVAEPYVRAMALRRYSPRTLAGEGVEYAGDIVEIMGRYPYQISDALDEVQDTLREVRKLGDRVDANAARTVKTFNRLAASIFVAALVIAASVVHFGPELWGIPVFSALLFVSALSMSFWLLVGFLRSGWL